MANYFNICLTCSTIITNNLEVVPLNLDLIKLILLCFPELDTEIHEKLVLCIKCLKDINNFYEFKNQCWQIENLFDKNKAINISEEFVNIHNVLQYKKGIIENTHLKNVDYSFNIVSELCQDVDNNYNENMTFSDICRTCLLRINENSSRFNIDFIQSDVEEISIRKKLYLCCPQLDLRGDPKAILCINCYGNINAIYRFKRKYYINKEKAGEYFNLALTSVEDLLINDSNFSIGEAEEVCNLFYYNDSLDAIAVVKSIVDSENFSNNLTDQQHNPEVKEKSLNCNICGYTTLRKHLFKQHIDIHTKAQQYKCTRCDFTSTHNGYLKRHLLSHLSHDANSLLKFSQRDYIPKQNNNLSNKLFKCSWCTYTTNRKFYLKEHAHVHLGEKPFKCSKCNFSYIKHRDLKIHLLNHTGQKPFKCKWCDYSTTLNGNLKKHTAIHTAIKTFKCSNCDYSSVRKNDVVRHTRTHTGEKPFKCTYCDFASTNRINLKNHMNNHMEEKCCKCPYCNFNSTQEYVLKRHMSTHTGKKPYQCIRCDFTCMQKKFLKQHLLTHTVEKQFNCKYCDYYTSDKRNLTVHISLHTRAQIFKCSQCDYSSIGKNNLYLHMRCHTKEKLFKCSQCNFSTLRSYTLKRHMLIHTGEKPFKCAQCGYVCSRKEHLKSHISFHIKKKQSLCV